MSYTLTDWIVESLQAIEPLGDATSARLSRGRWIVAYSIEGVSAGKTVRKTFEAMEAVQLQGDFWANERSAFRPRLLEEQGVVECRVLDPRNCIVWRASPDGRVFLVRDYREDNDVMNTGLPPRTIIEFQEPALAAARCVVQACAFATNLASRTATIRMRMIWQGLKQRRLQSFGNRTSFHGELNGRHDERTSEDVTFTPDSALDSQNAIIKRLTSTMYTLWGMDLPEENIGNWLR